MPPTKMKTMKYRKTTLDGLPRSAYSSKSKSQSTTEPKLREVTIPSENIPVNSDPSIVISKPTIKSEFPTHKAPIRIPPLTPSNLEELWAIWISDPRLPTRASRRAWAASRNIHPVRVDSWFRARKAKAKKLGQPIASDAYQLLPPAASVTLEVKRELTTPVISKPTIKSEFQEVKIPTQKAPIRIPSLTPSNLEELWAIWISDPRLPTRASRHAWAASRNIHPLRVDTWFRAREAKAEKLGQPIASEEYHLLCVPPAASLTLEVKRELTTPVPSRACDSDTTVDSPSGNTPILMDVGYYPGKHATYMPPKSSITPTPSITPEPTEGDPYYARYSSSVTRTLTPVTNYGQTASHSSDLHSPVSSLSIYDKAADSIFNNQGSVNQSSLPYEASRTAFSPPMPWWTPACTSAPATFRSSASWMESKLTNLDNRFEDSGVNTSNYH